METNSSSAFFSEEKRALHGKVVISAILWHNDFVTKQTKLVSIENSEKSN